MDEDDLPPEPQESHDDPGFGGAMGTTIGRLLWIALPMAAVLVIALIIVRAAH